MMSKTTKTLTALLLSAAAGGVAAEGLDGKSPMICAATTSIVCARQGQCVSGTPEAVNLPTFWHVDPTAKVAKSRRPDGEVRRSGIRTVSMEGGTLVLQGSDEGFGWTVSVDSSNGKMVLTGGSETAFLVFGECTTP
jgi:hypothetical protein